MMSEQGYILFDTIRERLNEDLRRKRRMNHGLFNNVTTDESIKEVYGSKLINNIIVAQSSFIWSFLLFHFIRGTIYSFRNGCKVVSDIMKSAGKWIKGRNHGHGLKRIPPSHIHGKRKKMKKF